MKIVLRSFIVVFVLILAVVPFISHVLKIPGELELQFECFDSYKINGVWIIADDRQPTGTDGVFSLYRADNCNSGYYGEYNIGDPLTGTGEKQTALFNKYRYQELIPPYRYNGSKSLALSSFLFNSPQESHNFNYDNNVGLFGNISSSPVIDGDTVYFTTDRGMLVAMDINKGIHKWILNFRRDSMLIINEIDRIMAIDRDTRTDTYYIKVTDANAHRDEDFIIKAPRLDIIHRGVSSPALHEQILFFGGTDGIYAVDTDKKRVKWSFITSRMIFNSPAVYNGSVYINGSDGYIYRLCIKTGDVINKYHTNTTEDTMPSEIAVSGNRIFYTIRNDTAVAIDIEKGDIKWEFPYLCNLNTANSPVISGNKLIIAGNDLHILDSESGTELYRTKSINMPTMPAVYDHFAYFGCRDGYLYSLDMSSGKITWKLKLCDSFIMPPSITADYIYISGITNYGQQNHSMFTIDRHKGALVWDFDLSNYRQSRLKFNEIPNTHIILYKGKMVFGTITEEITVPFERRETVYPPKQFLYRIDSKTHTLGAENFRYKGKTPVENGPKPVVNDKIIYTAGKDNFIYSRNIETGHVIWKILTKGNVYSGLVLWNNNLYFCSFEGALYSVDSLTGVINWTYESEDYLTATPFITEDRIYYGGHQGYLYCLRRKDGALLWKFMAEGGIESTPLIYKDLLIFGSWDSYLYALDKHTGEGKWRAGTKSMIRMSPLLKDDILYFADQEGFFYAVSLKQKRMKWVFKTQGQELIQPLLHEDTIITGSNSGFYYAINARSGRLLSEYYAVSGWWKKDRLMSPVIHEGLIYVSACSKSIAGLDPKTGRLRIMLQKGDLPAYMDPLQVYGAEQ